MQETPPPEDPETKEHEIEVERFHDEGGPVPLEPEDTGQTPQPPQPAQPDQPTTETPDHDKLAAERMTYEGGPDPDAETETEAK